MLQAFKAEMRESDGNSDVSLLKYTKKEIAPLLSLSLIHEISNFILGSKLANSNVIHEMWQMLERISWLVDLFASPVYYYVDKKVYYIS